MGQIINHLVLDPRDGHTMLATASTGHLGPTMFRSTDFGKHWAEAKAPPAFAKAKTSAGRSVRHTFWLTPGHHSEPGVWYAGTSPQGVFRSEDGGDTWTPISSVNDNPDFQALWGDDQGGTPDGPTVHSINIDPRDARHLYFGMSSGGVHESTDGGKTWRPLLAGMEVVDGLDVTNMAFHDP
ncbi:MAG: glycosyl hydrolase, partial [Alphaproteobacteria bacterium]|nr:glycosyl hydrolase [Alphaproteobacteria bacterium]